MTTPDPLSRADWPRDCPRPPAELEKLPFQRRPMVDWLAPKQLASTGLRAVLSAIFGAYADRREVQAALDSESVRAGRVYDAVYGLEPGDDGLWLDYCSDLGDGFDPTYGVAWTLSRAELAVPGVEGKLPRGRLLVLGGDQVYPTAHRTEYQNRFVGPYRAAFPWGPAERAPDLYAVPGNHDWYDGLTSFLRLFTQERWIGGWQTQQRRSYFALRLPAGWWLWGTDIQLDSELDEPQVRFFRQVARKMEQEAKAAGTGAPRVILCTAQPEWVFCDAEDPRGRRPPRRGCRLEVSPRRFSNLEYLQKRALRPFGVRLAAMLSGDLHHFTHYAPDPAAPESERAEHLITCGGGGAYLYPTHHMPERLAIPERRARESEGADPPEPFTHELAAVYPSAEDSRRLGRRSWWRLPWRNRRFATLLGSVYLVYAWVLQSVSKSANAFGPGGDGGGGPGSLMERLAGLGGLDLWDALRVVLEVLRHSPSGLVFGGLVVFGLWKFRQSAGRIRWRGVSGLIHGLAHLGLCFGLIWFFSWLNLELLGWGVDEWRQVLLFGACMLVTGAVLGGWLFGAYLALASRLSGAHSNEVFSSQSLTGFKSFLRLRVGRDGGLTIYPIGIPEVPGSKQWRYRGGDPALQPGDAWFEPPEGGIRVELIGGKPIEIS